MGQPLSFDSCTPWHPTPDEQRAARLAAKRDEVMALVLPILSRLSSKHEVVGDDAKSRALEEACRDVREAIRKMK